MQQSLCELSGTSNCKLNIPLPIPSDDEPPVGKENIYGVQIRVRDELKRPIADVEVQIGDVTVTTDEYGYAEVGDLLEGAYQLIAIKDGLTFLPQNFELGNKQLWTDLLVTPINELKVDIVPSIWNEKGHKVSIKAEQGENFNYDITTVNGGDKTATGGFIEYELPAGTELVGIRYRDKTCQVDNGVITCDSPDLMMEESHNDGNETCHLDYDVITCDLPDLVVGASYKIEVELKVVGQSDLKNVVALYSNEYPVDEAKHITTTKPYLSVFCDATPSPIKVLGTLSYECVVELSNNALEKVASSGRLVITLPKGMRFKSSPNNCAANDLIVTCALPDLSVVNPNNTSSVAVSMDVVLDDSGLLKLITKAEVMADNQSNHASKVYTEIEINRDFKADAVMLIDLTKSMDPLFNAIIADLQQQAIDQFNGAKPSIVVVGFRDYNDIKLVTATSDLNILLDKLGKLELSGGGKCEEASAEAFVLAMEHIKQGGIIMLATDAPHYDDPQTLVKVEKIKQAINNDDFIYRPLISSSDCEDGGSLNNIMD